MGWFTLLGAGVFEVAFTTCLKLSDGFTRLTPTLGFMAASIASFYLLTLAMREIPLGTAYLVWTSLGAVGTSVVGMLFFGDPVSTRRLAFMVVILVGVGGLWLAEN